MGYFPFRSDINEDGKANLMVEEMEDSIKLGEEGMLSDFYFLTLLKRAIMSYDSFSFQLACFSIIIPRS